MLFIKIKKNCILTDGSDTELKICSILFEKCYNTKINKNPHLKCR